jgi:hypothetical protein
VSSITRYWKTVIAAGSLALTLLTALPSVWGDNLPTWVPVAIAVLGSFLTWAKANTPPAGQPADPTVSETDPAVAAFITPDENGVQPLDSRTPPLAP